MAVYFDYKLGSGSTVHPRPCWSKDQGEPLLAAGIDNSLQIFSQEGERLVDQTVNAPQSKASTIISCLDWHPTQRLVCAGWSDGGLSFVRSNTGKSNTETASSPSTNNTVVHVGQEAHQQGSILAVKFSPTGNLCVAADERGVVSIYNTEGPRAQYMLHYRKQGAISKICFRPKKNPTFFFAGEQGVVYGADEHGSCVERYKVGSSIILLEYCTAANRVVLITAGTMLATFMLDADGKVKNETKLKLSCGPNPQSLRGVCIDTNQSFLLVTVSQESIVRVWNVLDEESYLLSLTEVDEKLMGDKAVAIDYNSRKRMLAVGTKQGRLVQWRSSTQQFQESDWQHLNVRNFDESGILNIQFGNRIGESILYVMDGRGACIILAETQLSHALKPPALAVQVAPSQLVISNIGQVGATTEDPNSAVIRRAQQNQGRTVNQNVMETLVECPFRIRGITAGPPYVAAWSAKQIRVYKDSTVSSSNDPQSPGELGIQIHSTFDRTTTLASCCLYVTKEEASLLVCIGPKIEICNLEGSIRKTLQFAASTEGSPNLLDIGGTTLIASTTKQILRLWNVARSTPKPLGSGRRFEDKNGQLFGEIRQLRANSNGSRVAILVDPNVNSIVPNSFGAAGPKGKGDGAPEGGKGSPKVEGKAAVEIENARIYVYDIEFDSFLKFDCGGARMPVSMSWDPTDPRLLAVETVAVSSSFSETNNKTGSPSRRQENGEEVKSGTELMTVFISENTLLVQDRFPGLKDSTSGVPLVPVSIVVPYFYFMCPYDATGFVAPPGRNKENGIPLNEPLLSKQVLRDFVGLEEVNLQTKKALLDFSYHIARGNPDEAYKAVSKNITSKLVWENLARMCVKTRRLDVVQKCVGQLANVRAASVLRETNSDGSKPESDPDVKLALVAAHLGMVADAEELYVKANRFDLLNRLYQASNDWEQAIEVAKEKDRVHLKTTYYKYAEYLETFDKNEARKYYKLAGCELPECARLLMQEGEQVLESYAEQAMNAGGGGTASPSSHHSPGGKNDISANDKFLRWYAQYLEAKQDLQGAIKCYTRSNDWASLVRLHCFSGDIAKAKSVCEETQCRAACFHLAGVLEQAGANAGGMDDDGQPLGTVEDLTNVKEAIRFYSLAGCVQHAIRLAEQSRLESDLMTLALSSNKNEDLIYAAKYYERFVGSNNTHAAKAVTLYQKAGNTARAMELCFRAKLYEPLKKIVEDVVSQAESQAPGSTPDPELLARCASFFMENSQHDKAVQLLCMGNQLERGIDLCYQHNVFITEEIAEKLTPEKTDSTNPEWRVTQLKKIAKLCKDQGSFQIACKKFTQAGDKVKAMKALLKSGDTERITYFAGTARVPEIYVLAANYLQSLDWHSHPEITKQILSFYSKAKDYRKMATFYEAIAQVEIDEFRDYDKAGNCLKDALKVLHKAQLELGPEYAQLEKRIKFVQQFGSLRNYSPDKVAQVCENFLQIADIENYLRVGDVYATLIEAYVSQGLYTDAHGKVEDMKRNKISLTPYIDQEVLRNIQKEVGMLIEEPATNWKANGTGNDDSVDEEIDEEISDNE